jgi:hypothetical protein
MDFVLKFNRAWAFFLVMIFGLFALNGTLIPVFVAAFVYLAISFLAVRQNRVAVIVVFIFSGLFMLRWLPMVIFNFFLMGIDDPVYLDSPATGLIVIIYALFFAFPSAYIFFSGLYHYQTVCASVLGKPFAEFSDHQKKGAFVMLALVAALSFLAFFWHIQALASMERQEYPSEKEKFDE